MKFDWLKLLRSFVFAARGLHDFARQQNARIHLIAAVAVILLGCLFGISRSDWLWIIAAIAMVLVAEALNTALEALADCVTPEYHPQIKKAKDIAAAAVLIAAVAAVLIGLLIFYSYLAE